MHILFSRVLRAIVDHRMFCLAQGVKVSNMDCFSIMVSEYYLSIRTNYFFHLAIIICIRFTRVINKIILTDFL